jgi:hypothetical protein
MMNKLLEAEELAFLAKLIARESDDHQSVALQLPQASPLMFMLGQAQGLELVATFQHHRLRFPVHLRTSEDFCTELVFDAPEILETGPTHRKWRLRPAENLRLFDQNGNDSGLNLLDLSDSSLSLSREDEDLPLPEQLDLCLELSDGGDRVPILARRVRLLDDSSAAYQVEVQEGPNEDRLRWFLFNHHPAITEQRDQQIQRDTTAAATADQPTM